MACRFEHLHAVCRMCASLPTRLMPRASCPTPHPVQLRELQPVAPGSAAGLRVGQTVYGIGNPWGLGHTLSKVGVGGGWTGA